jgi:hypothetical protein
MNWTVVWNRAELSRFAEVYVSLREQNPEAAANLTLAMAGIDRLLARSPETAGESRANYERLLIVPPLTVTFEPHPDEHFVYVMRFHYHSA